MRYWLFGQCDTVMNVWTYISKDIIANFNFSKSNTAKMRYQYSVYSEEFRQNCFQASMSKKTHFLIYGRIPSSKRDMCVI